MSALAGNPTFSKIKEAWCVTFWRTYPRGASGGDFKRALAAVGAEDATGWFAPLAINHRINLYEYRCETELVRMFYNCLIEERMTAHMLYHARRV